MCDELVSIIIPTFNYGHFVAQAVASALAQTYSPCEVIVVDDGSTDDTQQRLEPFGDQIRYLYQPNQGLSAARNTGIHAARGEFIALLDADDLWHPQKLEVQTRYLRHHPHYGLVAADKLIQAEPPSLWPRFRNLAVVPARSVTQADLIVKSRFGAGSVLVRSRCFAKVGQFDTGLQSAEDRDMWLRIVEFFPIAVIALPLWWYRLHGNNMSKACERMERAEMAVLQRALAACRDATANRYGSLAIEDQSRNATLNLLRRKAVSYALRSAAYRYEAAGFRIKALGRVMRSMWVWPMPFHREEARTVLERPKMLILFLLRLLRGILKPT